MDYKWKVFSVTSIAVLMVAVDSTVVLLAIYPIESALNSNFVTIVWIVMAYLLVTTTFGLSLGRLGDLFGRKLMFNIGFIVFTIGSGLCGLSQTGLELVAFRGVQGFGGALILSNAFAILSEVFPARERGKAFGINAVVWNGGSILGIVLGGVIIGVFNDWRLIFYINIPIGVFGTYWAYRTIHPPAPRAADAKKPYFDMPGAITFTGGVLSLLLGVTDGIVNHWQWSNMSVWLPLALAPVFFVGFILWELRYSLDPLFHPQFFTSLVFSTSVATVFLQTLAIFSVNFLLLFYFEGVAKVPILTASLLVLPMALASSVAGPLGGILSDRIGPKYIASGGLACQAVVLFFLTRLTASTTLPEVGILEALFGMGGGLFFPANTSTIMSASPPGKFGVGSGIMNTFRNTGMILSFAVSLTAITAMVPGYIVAELFLGTHVDLDAAQVTSYLSGQAFAFEISLALLIVGLALVLWKAPGKMPSPAGQSWKPAGSAGAGVPGGTPTGAPQGASGASVTNVPSRSPVFAGDGK